MDPWKNWAIATVLIGGAAYYYSTTGGQKKRPSGFKPYNVTQTQTRNSSRSRNKSKDKKRTEKEASGSEHVADETPDASTASAQASGSDALKKNKQKPAKKEQPSNLAQTLAAEVANELEVENVGEDEGMDNQEFAKQLSDKMTGTSLKKPENTQNKKARKQVKRAEAFMAGVDGKASKSKADTSSKEDSTPSSTTGADADDDLSPTNSPEIGAISTTAPSGGDVSDMLEPPPKAPSVLRLTEPANREPQRQPRQQKTSQEPETKKQRQNKRKNEELKAMREQAEQERRVALENQRRIVREAEGRPAKNGLGTSYASTSNAWSNPSKVDQSNRNPRTAVSQDAVLLDTFEERTPPAATTGKPLNDLPSEEEQMKMLSEMESDNAWNTVSKGGRSKRKAGNLHAVAGNGVTDVARAEKNSLPDGENGDTIFPKGAPGTSLNAQPNGVKSTLGKTRKEGKPNKPGKATRETIDHSVWNRSNIHEHPDYDPAFPYALTGHPEDSEWAVV